VKVNPFAVRAMQEIGIDISHHQPKNVDQFINQPFDYVITVCDNAMESCPVFVGREENRIHLGFEDPAEAQGTDDETTSIFRRTRDEIKETFFKFYSQLK
jgi:arsenate reductase